MHGRPTIARGLDVAIAEWYRDLSDLERSTVRAAAILNGAPAHEVMHARNELYGEMHPDHQSDESERTFSDQVLIACHLVTRKVSGTQRLYWTDTTAGGVSAFGVKVLTFIAGEIQGTWGYADENIRMRLTRWVTNTTGGAERARRAARALGIIWQTLDARKLEDLAQDWASTTSPHLQEAAADVLTGAYVAERTAGVAQSDSTVRELLEFLDGNRSCHDDCRPLHPHDRVSLCEHRPSMAGCRARWPRRFAGAHPARAYGRVSGSPGGARRGVVYGSLGYVELASSGQFRTIIARLAHHMDRLLDVQLPPAGTKGYRDARAGQRQSEAVVYFVVFLLVAWTAEDVDDARAADSYQYDVRAALPQRPTLPDSHGMDPLLAAIVSSTEVRVRHDLLTLLAGAFTTGRAPVASEVLRQWADVIVAQAPDADNELQVSYARFLCDLGTRLRTWQGNLPQQGGRESRDSIPT